MGLSIFLYKCTVFEHAYYITILTFNPSGSCQLMYGWVGTETVHIILHQTAIRFTLTGVSPQLLALLADLSRRLIGELIVYPCSGVCRTSSSVGVHNFKRLLVLNRLDNQSQIIIIMSLFNEDNIFSKFTNLTYCPLKSKTTRQT